MNCLGRGDEGEFNYGCDCDPKSVMLIVDEEFIDGQISLSASWFGFRESLSTMKRSSASSTASFAPGFMTTTCRIWARTVKSIA